MIAALLGLALAAVPVEDIAAQFGAETQATNISCTAYDATTYCYGVGSDGAIIGATFADGVFTPLAGAVAAVAPAAARRPLPLRLRPATSFGDGIWLVGTDMAPGNYRAVIDSEGFFDSATTAGSPTSPAPTPGSSPSTTRTARASRCS